MLTGAHGFLLRYSMVHFNSLPLKLSFILPFPRILVFSKNKLCFWICARSGANSLFMLWDPFCWEDSVTSLILLSFCLGLNLYSSMQLSANQLNYLSCLSFLVCIYEGIRLGTNYSISSKLRSLIVRCTIALPLVHYIIDILHFQRG